MTEEMIEEVKEEEEHHHHDHDEDCKCGCHDHDHEHEHHHHDHDDECCHDHEHHHHHDDDDDDDEECKCGCHDHDHEHHHHHDDDDECECGHDHEHHHHEHGEHCDCEDCVSGVSIVHHDTALAGSFSVETKLGKDELDAIIREGMMQIKNMIDEREGVIGHIKSAISSGDISAMYSLTYDQVQRVGEFDQLANVDSVSFASIVYGADEHELRSLLVSIKEKIEVKEE